MKSVLIVSGGMDSITLLYDKRPSHALSFDYGSKHNTKELEFAREHCQALGIEHHVISLSFIGELFSSSLLKTGGDIPEGHYADESMKSTVVPFRNGIMLAIAVGYAESIGAEVVYLGSHAGDHAIYPDCRPEFNTAIQEAARLGTYIGVRIEAPYSDIDKRGIALIGKSLGVPYERTWTCYKGQARHCGRCGSCTERKEALLGFDETEYED